MGGRIVFMLEADVLHDGGGPVRRRQGKDPLTVRLAPQHGVVAVVIAVMGRASDVTPRGGHRVLQ